VLFRAFLFPHKASESKNASKKPATEKPKYKKTPQPQSTNRMFSDEGDNDGDDLFGESKNTSEVVDGSKKKPNTSVPRIPSNTDKKVANLDSFSTNFDLII